MAHPDARRFRSQSFPMRPPDSRQIRHRVLQGLARNREPGFHFAGNFLGVSFAGVTAGQSRVCLEAGPHCEEADGQVNLGAVALLADIALASAIRAQLTPEQRLATVSMHLQFTGAPMKGRLEATGSFEGFLEGGSGQQGLSRVALVSDDRKVVFGSGSFMALKPPPGVTMHPLIRPARHGAASLEEKELTAAEAAILQRADEAIAKASARHSFIRRFWGQDPRATKTGASCSMEYGAHIGNRVGHAQGGLLVGLAATTAQAALPATWMLSGISAWFVSPGEGRAMNATSRIVHHGRLTAVVRTVITGKDRRRVLEAMTTHALQRHARPAE
jgi:acyl-coenzyme A thioesterase PaaI-like protein